MALRVTYENEGLAEGVARYGEAGHMDAARHHERARRVVRDVMTAAARVVRVRIPQKTDVVEAQRWLLDAVLANLPRA
jgi:hypothetical protein